MVRDLNIRKKTAQPRNMVWALRINIYIYIHMCVCAWAHFFGSISEKGSGSFRGKNRTYRKSQLRPRVLIRTWWEGILKWLDVLVGGILPLRKIWVSWDDSSQKLWKVIKLYKIPWFRSPPSSIRTTCHCWVWFKGMDHIPQRCMNHGYWSYGSMDRPWVQGIDQGPTFWALSTAYINIYIYNIIYII